MTINGIFFDLYGTLLVYGNMDAAWSDWLRELHKQLRWRGLTHSIESLAKTCDQFFGKSEPTPRQHNLTVFEQRIQNLSFDLKLNLTPEDLKEIASKIADAWQKHIPLDSEALHVLNTLHRSKKLALVSNFDHPPHVHSVLSKHGLTHFFDSVVISAEVGVKKPDPRIFDSALDRTGTEPKDVIYVGDTEDDTKAARAAGIVPVLIQRENEGNAFDFSVNKPNVAEREFTLDVKTITKLSELITLFA
ncbi:MAG: HAD family hydrolase [Candidatus Poribacteria bacterium]|nr:HAD family hydrolase [Candidatus Poribacteria bacterium]